MFLFLNSFKTYENLWNDNVQDALKKFRDHNPKLEDFEEKLKEFTSKQNNIAEIEAIK